MMDAPNGFTYNCKITIEATCKETGKSKTIERDVEYYAGRVEPDTNRLAMKVLRKGSVA